MTPLYYPQIFNQLDEKEARAIILTTERGIEPDARWQQETPDTISVFLNAVHLPDDAVVVDYGCGIGRLARELLSRRDVTVIGVDMSADMRAQAVSYVGHPKFVPMSPEAFQSLVQANALRVDMTYSVYVLQHVYNPASVLATLAQASRNGLFIINAIRRAVPAIDTETKEFQWADDGLDLRALCLSQFPHAKEIALNKAIYALADEQFCAVFSKRP